MELNGPQQTASINQPKIVAFNMNEMQNNPMETLNNPMDLLTTPVNQQSNVQQVPNSTQSFQFTKQMVPFAGMNNELGLKPIAKILAF